MTSTGSKRLGRFPTSFLRLSDRGQNGWWRYLLGVLVLIIASEIIGPAPLYMLYGFADSIPGASINEATGALQGVDPSVEFVLAILSSLILIAALHLVVTVFHRRKFLSIITTAKRIRWRQVAYGFFLWAVLITVSGYLVGMMLLPFGAAPIDASADGGNVNLFSFGLFVLLGIALTPIQTSSEELLFRGYLLQLTYRIGRRVWVPVVATSLLFAYVHFFSVGDSIVQWPVFLGYFAFGLLAALVTLKDGGLELALGMHAANNIILVPTMYANPSAPAVAMGEPFGDQLLYLVITAASAGVFWVLTFRYRFRFGKA